MHMCLCGWGLEGAGFLFEKEKIRSPKNYDILLINMGKKPSEENLGVRGN